MRITLRAAQEIIEAAHQRALELDVPSAVAVVDAGGNLLAFAAHENAILAARDLSIGKAFTALSLHENTEDLGESVLPDGPFFGLNNALLGRPLVTFGGGRPLRAPGQRTLAVGAVGVSGGSVEDDIEICATAVRHFAHDDEAQTRPV